MSEKLTQAAARYVVKSRRPGERCGLCSMFRKPYTCTDVQGHIKPAGWCKLFDRRVAEYASGGNVMSDADVGLAPAFDPGKPFQSVPPPPPGYTLVPPSVPPPPAGYELVAPAFDPSRPFKEMSDADVGLAPQATWNPRTWKPAEGPGAFITDVPREAYVATADAMAGTAQGLNPLSKEHAVQPWDPSKGVGENLAEQAGKQWERVKSAGSGLASAVSVPFAPFVGAARSLVGHPLAEAVSASRRVLGEPEKSKAETYEEAKQGVDTAMMAMGPRGRAMSPVPVPPRPAPSGPLGVTLSRGQETGELALIQREQAALRGQEGAPAQRRAQEFADQQREQLTQAHEEVSRALDPVHGPNTVVYGSRHGQVIAETPQEAGALVSQSVRGAAAQRKAGVTEAYDIAKAQPGEVHAAAFEGIGQKIKGELSLRDDPIIIDDKLTPHASRAIQDIEERVAKLRIQNRADPFGEPNPENIVGVSLRGVDQMRRRLSAFRNDAYGSGNTTDGRAAKAVIDAFDNEVDRAINSGLFSGNRSAVQAWNDARAAHADYRKTFSGSKNDSAGRVVEKIIGKGDNPAAIPNDVADFLYGSSGVNPGSLNVAVANRVKGILGEQSPEWTAVKQGLFSRLSATGEGMRDMGPGKVAERLNRFLNVDGRELAHALYSPAEIDLIRQYANLMRRIEVPQTGANWPNTATFLQKSLNHIGSKIGMVIGAAVGHVIAPGMPWGISEGVGAGIAKGVGKIGERSQARVVAKQMPLIADQIRQWQRAVRAANRANSPLSQKALGVAAANLAQSLERIGVRGQAPALPPSRAEQAPALPPSRAEDNGSLSNSPWASATPNAPWPIATPYRADGGAVFNKDTTSAELAKLVRRAAAQRSRDAVVRRLPQRANGGRSDQSPWHPAQIGAKRAGDGQWYLPDPDRPGKYLRVEKSRHAEIRGWHP